ncbi:MAG: hypothetical protein KBB70_00990 [Candidatus Pacebacteria bacterium]|nr:hypothetical protein [Candidatus Paceibacterota bacterium]
MKTISELNSKWWYRLVKVIFIGCILLAMTIATFIFIDEYSPSQSLDYKISCVADYTNHKETIAYKDESIFILPLNGQTVYQSLSDNNKQEIRNICGISNEEADQGNATALAYINEQTKLGTSSAIIQKYIDDNLRPYKVSEEYITEGGYVQVVLYSILAAIGILLIAEIIRRIFYYIVLGSLRPKKKHESN